MHIPVLIEHPQMLGTVVRNTPAWVGALFAGLLWTGVAQIRDRRASLVRVAVLPVVMIGLSIWGMAGAFGSSPMFGYVMLAWMLVGAMTFAAVGLTSAPKGTEYDPASRSFFIPGSWVPLVTIVAIFLTRDIVNVDVAVQPLVARETDFTLVVAAIYGLFSGVFLGRAARLWRLAAEGSGFRAAAPHLQ
jgi:hypothetical protein